MAEVEQHRQRKWDYATYLYAGGVLMVIGTGVFAAGIETANDVLGFLGAIAVLVGFSGFLIGAIARGVELGVRAATENPTGTGGQAS